MTAQTVQKTDKNEVYFHIYNKGVDNRNLFKDDQDCEAFLSYLKDYLTAPPDPKELKKTFSVKGRTFQGVPHQPKNFFNKVELIAYNLMPNHFHLVVKEISQGSLVRLTRALSTRYAIYYNKKYQRRGSLFAGPYKSVQITDTPQLLYLTRHLHREVLERSEKSNKNFSSYEEFLGTRKSVWIKPELVLSNFNNLKNKYFGGINDYKDFVEKYELKQEEKKSIENIIIESKPEHVEKRVPKIEESSPPKEVSAEPVPEPRPKILEFIATATMVFILLFSVGIRNVLTSSADTSEFLSPTPDPQVSGLEDEISEPQAESISPTPSPTPKVSGIEDIIDLIEENIIEDEKVESPQAEGQEPEAKTMIVIKITDGSESVNLREKPTISSAKVGEARHGETFEFVSIESGWYQFKLDNEEIAFVSARYAEIEEVIEEGEIN